MLLDYVNLVPYAWQSPKCLAEFRERNISKQAREPFRMGMISLLNRIVSLLAKSVLG